MGFPTWTLIGMGVTVFVALLAVALAYLAQSPRFLARLGLAGYRLDLRLREFTGLALAMLLLTLGFFLAGVPLGAVEETAVSTPQVTLTAVAGSNESMSETGATTAAETAAETAVTLEATAGSTRSESGAFGNPPAAATETPAAAQPTNSAVGSDDVIANETIPPTNTPTQTPTPAPTNTPRNTSTPTPSPTVTSTPTLTPTPIDGDTAFINTGGSTLWIRRTPGGQRLVLVRNGEEVLISTGHANQGGILWQEIRTVDGVIGWVQEEFITFNN